LVGWDTVTPIRKKEHHIDKSAKERLVTLSPTKSIRSFDRKNNSESKIPTKVINLSPPKKWKHKAKKKVQKKEKSEKSLEEEQQDVVMPEFFVNNKKDKLLEEEKQEEVNADYFKVHEQ